MSPEVAVEEAFRILAEATDVEYIGEPVTQLEHALQAAALAAQSGARDALVLAALLHDIGHLCAGPEVVRMGDYGVMDHEGVGARFLLGLGFSEEVARLVGAHVKAKRFLAFSMPGYYAKLSPASLKTFEYQGGMMTAEEVDQFKTDPLWADMLKLRSWDEQAKRVGWDVPVLESYRRVALRHIRTQLTEK